MHRFIFVICAFAVWSSAGQDITFGGPKSRDDSSCITIDGGNAGQPCVFPFIFGNNTYNECIIVSDPDFLPWCSTKVDENGVHIAGGGFWGHCSEECPGAEKIPPESNPEEEQKKLEEDLKKEKATPEVTCKTASGLDGHCLTPSLCVGLSDDDVEKNKCPDAKDANSIAPFLVCCTDLTKNTPPQASTLAAPATTTTEAAPPASVSVDDVRRAFDEADQGGIVFSSPTEGPTEPTTTLPPQPDNELTLDPASAHLRFNQPNSFALDVNDAAQNLIQITNDIKSSKNLSDEEAGIGLRSFDFEVEVIDKRCPWTPSPTCGPEQIKFRTPDGSCNNIKEPNFGRAGTPLQRILDPSYGDKNFNAPRASVNTVSNGLAFELPSARVVSNTMTSEADRISQEHTVLVMQMGQFIDHDITHTPTHSVSCCNRDGSFPESFDSQKCFPIDIPADDPFWKGRLRCMSFARSLASPTLKCSLEFQQQMNQITHWLDASNIYGSSASEAKELRENFDGLMKIGRLAGSKSGILPQCTAARVKTVSMCSGCPQCLFAGDSRANEHLNLLSIHTVWLREHNRVARSLKKLNLHWDDERLYQEARKIVIAEYQHIIFKEWLPIIVGNDYMTNFGLWPLSKGYSTDYITSFDPRVTNEFSTAAFRFGHSLIPHQFNRINPRRARQGQSAALTGTMNLAEIFFKPQQMTSSPAIVDELVSGLASQQGNIWDESFVPDVRNHLFESKVGTGGLDLVALNIQRGRDHGIKGYNFYREICSLGRATTWGDFQDLIDTFQVEKLRNLYAHVDDVDLFVGGFLEHPEGGSILGPTFRCLVGDTFSRLKLGDRFFYDLNMPESGPHFTEDQLNQIRKTSMARILCDNTDNLDSIQPQAFRLPGSSSANSVQFCSTSPNIPKVNLGVFKEEFKSGR